MIAANNVPISKHTGVAGWLTQEEEDLLIKLARENVADGGVVIGLGVEYGRSTAALMRGSPKNITYYAVDMFPGGHQFAKDYGGLKMVFDSNMTELGLREEITILHIHSHEAAAMYERHDGAPVDLVFVDAGHSYNEVRRDIEAWAPLVKPNGVMIFHDYWRDEKSHALHREVKRAVDEWWEEEGWWKDDGVDSTVYFVKPDNTGVPPGFEEEEEAPSGTLEIFSAGGYTEYTMLPVDNNVVRFAEFEDEGTPDILAGETQSASGDPGDVLMTVKELSDEFFYTLATVKSKVRKLNSKGKRGRADLYLRSDFVLLADDE